jgi:putative hydrolase of the HAD superfamily
MSKVVLLDLDGIVIRPRFKYFSEKFSEEYNIPLSEITPFFEGEYRLAARGQADVRVALPGYLEKWGWKRGLDEFLNYWFHGERTIDVNVLEVVKKLRERGVKVYFVSDNEKERADYVMNTLRLNDDSDGAFFSYQLGHTKSEPEFFREVLSQLGVDAKDVEFWDDDPKNVEVAKEVGINSHVYTSYEEFKERILK